MMTSLLQMPRIHSTTLSGLVGGTLSVPRLPFALVVSRYFQGLSGEGFCGNCDVHYLCFDLACIPDQSALRRRWKSEDDGRVDGQPPGSLVSRH